MSDENESDEPQVRVGPRETTDELNYITYDTAGNVLTATTGVGAVHLPPGYIHSTREGSASNETITIDGVEYEVEDDGSEPVIATGELYDGPPITYQLEPGIPALED